MKQCITCSRWWHTQCVSLQGLKENELNLLKSWLCPLCYTLPEGVKNVNKPNDTQSEIETLIQSESTKIMEEIQSVKKLVAATLKKELNKNLDEQTNKWNNVLQDNREETSRVISQTITENNTRVISEVVNSSKQQMDADKREREMRKCNIVISDLIESKARLTTDKSKHDRDYATQVLGLDDDEIVKVRRAGPPPQGEQGRPRPLIVTVLTPELANQLHDYGRGVRRTCTTDRRIAFWVNPDLIKADREANFKAREAARDRFRGRENQRRGGNYVVPDNLSPVSSARSSRQSSPAGSVHSLTLSHQNSPEPVDLLHTVSHNSSVDEQDL